MKRLTILAMVLLLGAGAASAQTYKTVAEKPGPLEGAHQAWYVEVSGRYEARQPFYLLKVDAPKAQVILFPGGAGNPGVSAKGIKRGGNFLVRTRGLFADRGFNVAVMDVPTDRPTLEEFRTHTEHRLDIAAVIDHLRRLSPAPVWLVGTSRGTISAANYASNPMRGHDPDGLVLTSSLVWLRKDRETVFSPELWAIKTPTLVVHHRQDACRVTPFENVTVLVERLSAAKPVELIPVTAGKPGKPGQACKGRSHHGFLGQEAEVVARIAAWIAAHGS